MEKILIVEDDADIAQIESDYLQKEGYQIIWAKDGNEALTKFDISQPDLVVLDLNLPIKDGYTVCKELRHKSGVPIIMVTAKTKEIDEILGLEIGADDYIKKPFSPRVLVSRVKALLKRPELQRSEQTTIQAGDILIDLAKRTVTKTDELIALTTIQFNLLTKLIQSPGKVFSREMLMDSVYDKGDLLDIFDRTIDSHIKNIRKLIEDDPKHPKYIVTVRGAGYKFDEQSQ